MDALSRLPVAVRARHATAGGYQQMDLALCLLT